MPEIQYPKNPNSDTVFVVQEDGTKNRALMTAPQDTSTLELPSNANSTKGYVTIDGKKQRVILTADIGGGGGGSVDKNTIINKAATLPAASASNVGQVYMYDGADTEDYTHGYIYQNQPTYTDPSATISQTAGSGLTDLSVDVDTFVETEQPSGSETVSFVASGTAPTVELYNKTPGDWSVSVNPAVFIPQFENETGLTLADIAADDECYLEYYTKAGWVLFYPNGQTNVSSLEDWGFDISGDLVAGLQVFIRGIPGSQEWSKNGTTVDLADYGISYTGTPANGDTLTVAYTAGGISGYVWNQINVQPGGTEGIKWETALDLPENYSGSQWDTSAIVTIPGGLPDGDYEFYYRTLCYSEPEYAPKRYATTKVQFHFNSASANCSGSFAPVVDGNWMPSANYGIDDINESNMFGSHGNDFVFLGISRPFATDVPAYNDVSGGLKDCFKVSSFKNIQTGQEYIPVLTLYDGTNDPRNVRYGGEMRMVALQQDPYIPQYHVSPQWEYDDNKQYARLQPYHAIALSGHPAACSEFDVSLVSSNGGKWHCVVENGYDSYVARVLEASGDLASVQIGFNGDGQTFLFFNTASGTSGYIYAAIGAKGSSDGVSGWIDTPDSFTPATITKIGGAVTQENLGTILQYNGATDANYTNGYFYKATGTVVTVPESITTTILNYPNEATVTIDTANWIAELQTVYGWNREEIQTWLRDYSTNEWNVVIENGSIVRMYIPWYGDTFDANILQWVSATYTGSETGQVMITFNETYTAEHTEIQNGRWERVDVQPSGTANKATGAYATGIGENTTSFNVSVTGAYATGVGPAVQAAGDSGTAIGCDAMADGNYSLALGVGARANAAHTIVLSAGERGVWVVNNNAETLLISFGTGKTYTLVRGDGTIPPSRLGTGYDATKTQTLKNVQGVLTWVDDQ